MIGNMHRYHDAGGTRMDEPLTRDLPRYRPSILVALAALLVGAFALGLLVVGLPPGDDSPEAGFARDMGMHHTQAVEMAEIARDRTSDPEVHILAVDIALGQQAQIGQMQGWLAVWGLPATGMQPAMTWMGHTTAAGSLMPGMATVEDLTLLRHVAPDKVDAMFLQLMIAHHRGGVQMAEGVLARTQRPEVRRLAQAIVNGQLAEIEGMSDLLRRKGASVPTTAANGTSMAMAGHTMGPSLFTVRSTTFRDLILYAPLALATFAGAWLAVIVTSRPRQKMADTSLVNSPSEGMQVLAIGSLVLGAGMHLGLWPTYTLGQAGTGLLFGVAAIGMAATGGATLAQLSLRSCVAGAGFAALASAIFVVLRLLPSLAGSGMLPLDGVELIVFFVDFIALSSCGALWLRALQPPSGVRSEWPGRAKHAG